MISSVSDYSGGHLIVENNVLASALRADSADFVVATFGLKTFNEVQHRELAGLVARVLKPGGTFAFVEAPDPMGWWLRPLYRFHLKVVLPLIERTILRGAQDFAMIGTCCDAFGDARGFGAALNALTARGSACNETRRRLKTNSHRAKHSRSAMRAITCLQPQNTSPFPKGQIYEP